MSYPAHARATLALGLPIVGSHLAQMLLHVGDTILVGRYGTEPLAAVVLGASSFFILFLLGSGFAIAAMGMIASALGRGDDVRVRRETRMALWLSILFGLVSIPCFWWSGAIFVLLGQDPGVAELTGQFLQIAVIGMAPALIVMVLKSYLAALEKTQVVLWVTLVAAAVNFGLAYVLIFGRLGMPELGIRGAALASLLTQVLTAVLLGLYAAYAPISRRYQLFVRFWRPDWPAFFRVFRIGLPAGITGLAESGLFVAAAIMMGWIGKVELAAHGIAMEIAGLAFMVHLGLSNAATVRVGRAEGERDPVQMRAAALTATFLSICFALIVVTTMLAFPTYLISPFLDTNKPDAGAIIAFGARLLAIAALFQLFDAMQVMALGLLRGVQDTRRPMWITGVSYWLIGVPASYVLAFRAGMGGIGLWLGLAIGLAAAASMLMMRFWRGPWLTRGLAA